MVHATNPKKKWKENSIAAMCRTYTQKRIKQKDEGKNVFCIVETKIEYGNIFHDIRLHNLPKPGFTKRNGYNIRYARILTENFCFRFSRGVWMKGGGGVCVNFSFFFVKKNLLRGEKAYTLSICLLYRGIISAPSRFIYQV